MRLLALDLSTRVGFAVFRGEEDPKPLFGTYRLPVVFQDNIGARCFALRSWLRSMIDLHAPEVVAFEAPMILLAGPTSTTAQTVRLLVSLCAEAETTAVEAGVPHIIEVANATARVALAGTARLGPRSEAKNAMIVAATKRGFAISDDNQADAAGVALAAYEHLNGG